MRNVLFRLAAPVLMLALILSGCQKSIQEEPVAEKTVYTSFFPFYALAEGLFEGVPNMRLKNLVQPQDGCLRSYELSDWDAALVGSADAMIIGGRGMESFEGLLIGLEENGPALISALDGLTLINQGQQIDDELESHLQGPNPWLFLSVEGAGEVMESIAQGMMALDPSFQALYAQNLERRQDELEQLQQQMLQLLIKVEPQPVALMHEGLPYLAGDLGLYVAVQVDREPGSELYDADLDEALAKLKDGGARVILLEKQAPDQLKRALEQEGYVPVLIDTLSTFPFDTDAQYYDRVMLGNAQAVADAFRGA